MPNFPTSLLFLAAAALAVAIIQFDWSSVCFWVVAFLIVAGVALADPTA